MRLFLNGSMLVALTVLLCCSANNKGKEVYQVFDNGFSSSYKLINRQNQMILASLESKKYDPVTAAIATRWYDKAIAIKESSDGMKEYIEKLKSSIQENSTLKLYDSLEHYKQYVLNVDPKIKQEFYSNIILIDSSLKNEEEALKGDISIPLLSYFQNNVAMVENRLISFCNEQFTSHRLYHENYLSLVTQNIKYAKPGDEIVITAGIGAFTLMLDEKITIAGDNIPLNESAVAVYKIKAPSGIGKHIYPVRIEYKDQDGKLQWITKEFEFTVMR
jgi:hypothetical protein